MVDKIVCFYFIQSEWNILEVAWRGQQIFANFILLIFYA